ncbi:2-hydroxycarboxylate transporter family protein [Photobacterium sp. DNB23_23_1]
MNSTEIELDVKDIKNNDEKSQTITVNGMSIYLWAACCAIIICASLLGVLPNSMAGAMAICFGAGFISFAVGNRVKFIREYMGGGVLITLFLGASIKHFGLLPQSTIDTVFNFIAPWGFLNIFIVVLVIGSIVTIDRTLLIAAVSKFIPTIIAAVIGAAIVATLIGSLFGMSPSYVLCYFVMPIMSGGSGAGALPIAEMYHSITGNSFEEYISVAMAMLSVGDLFAIIIAGIANKLIAGRDTLTGNGEMLRAVKASGVTQRDHTPPSMADLANCLLIISAIYMLAIVFNKLILPTLFGIPIHTFAYVVIITMILKVSNIIPANITAALIYSQKYFIQAFVVIIMFCCGMSFMNLEVFITSITNIGNIMVCFGVVSGAFLGGALFGNLVGFFPFEAGVTSGLCMANAGGAGDIAVLSACKRMRLIPYAQVSSRVGNAMILIISGVIFTLFA